MHRADSEDTGRVTADSRSAAAPDDLVATGAGDVAATGNAATGTVAAHSHAAEAARTRSQAGSSFRTDLEGFRGLAVLAVVVYHVWLGRVSGGVDVFFVLSGFFATGALLRRLDRSGRVPVTSTVAHTFKRLTPVLATMLLAVSVATLLLLPQSQWYGIAQDVIFSGLYLENIHLALTSGGYFTAGSGVSPMQHVWSLSIQGQIYLLWPAILALAVWLATRLRRSRTVAVTIGVAAVTLLSFTYAVYAVGVDQSAAYYSGPARLWEFSLGGVIAVAAAHLQLRSTYRALLGWLGVLGFVVCGMLIPGGSLFPGPWALWPTLCTVAVIVAGFGGTPLPAWGPQLLLDRQPLRWVGRQSYALYAWHWPVLVITLSLTGRQSAGLLGGLAIIAASLLLAWATTRFLERPIRTRPWLDSRPALQLTTLGMATLVVLVPSLEVVRTVRSELSAVRDQNSTQQAPAGQDDAVGERAAEFPGALALVTGETVEGYIPSLTAAGLDTPDSWDDGCAPSPEAPSDLVTCLRGAEDGDVRVAVIGNSKVIQWEQPLSDLGTERGWQITTMFRGACPMTLPEDYVPPVTRSQDRPSRGTDGDSTGTDSPDAGSTDSNSTGSGAATGGSGRGSVGGYLPVVNDGGLVAASPGTVVPVSATRTTVADTAPSPTALSDAVAGAEAEQPAEQPAVDPAVPDGSPADPAEAIPPAEQDPEEPEEATPSPTDPTAEPSPATRPTQPRTNEEQVIAEETPEPTPDAALCAEWNAAVMDSLLTDPPDLVLTTGTVRAIGEESEYVPDGYVAAWQLLAEAGVPVVALRDTPRTIDDALGCIERVRDPGQQCGRSRAVIDDLDDVIEAFTAQNGPLPDTVTWVDTVDLVCTATSCPAVVGGIIVYLDEHHLTNTYAASTRPLLADALDAASPVLAATAP